MDILLVTVTGYRTMTIEGYGAAFVGSALLLTSVCLTDYHNLKREGNQFNGKQALLSGLINLCLSF